MIENLKNIFHEYKTKKNLLKGIKEYQKTGVTTPETYKAFRKMFLLSKGKFNDTWAQEIGENVGKTAFKKTQGVLGKHTRQEIINMVENLKADGFYIFDSKLLEKDISAICNFALQEPVNFLDVQKNKISEEKILFNPQNIISPRYDFSRESILKSHELQKLIFDESLFFFAQEYLGCTPILDHLGFWWSAPFFGKGKSKAAQMYHFDMDRIKFIKFFFYLTDVETQNGPHCYVKGSHKTLPKSITRDGRIQDEEIERIYGAKNCVELLGKQGTILAVDTRGYHKGKELVKGNRLLFQIEFAISMFGQTYKPLSSALIEEPFKAKANTYSYNKIFKNA